MALACRCPPSLLFPLLAMPVVVRRKVTRILVSVGTGTPGGIIWLRTLLWCTQVRVSMQLLTARDRCRLL